MYICDGKFKYLPLGHCMSYVSDHIHVFSTMQYYAAVHKYIHVLFVCIFILNMVSIKQCSVVHISVYI